MTEVIDVVDCVGLFEAFACKARQSINISDRVSGKTPNETKFFKLDVAGYTLVAISAAFIRCLRKLPDSILARQYRPGFTLTRSSGHEGGSTRN
jgi:hypothetical protein